MLELIRQILGPAGIVFVILALVLVSGIKILKEYHRAVVFRLGRMVRAREAWNRLVIPLIERWSASICTPSPWTCRRRMSSLETTFRSK